MPDPDLVQLADAAAAAGMAAGLDAVGVADARPFDETRQVLEARKAAGLAAGMAFTYRNPARSTDPARSLPGARSLIVGARRYRRADRPPPGGRHGFVARYSWRDHYAPLRAALEQVAATVEAAGWRARVLVDDNALVDRAAAHRAGIGWYGKSANLLVPGAGSWFVLGSVVTDAPLPATAEPVGDGCGACTRCLDECPTGAIVAPGVVDARRCLAWLLEAPGPFPVEHRRALGDRIYGCDDCQEVCPPNRAADRRVAPPPAERDSEPWVDLVALLDGDDATLLERFGRWYVPRRDPRFLRRNALVALGNIAPAGDAVAVRVLERYANGDDELLAEHARWALDEVRGRS